MEINKNNYEAYFLDFVEGSLTPSQKAEMDLFLIHHPELKSELDDFELLELEAESVLDCGLKASIKKEETTGLSELEYLIISEIEGTSSNEEKKKLAALIKIDSSIEKEIEAYAKTKLSKSENLVFPNKNALLKRPGKLIYLFRYASAAAAAVLAFVYFNINSVNEKYHPRTAKKNVINQYEEEIKYAFVVAEKNKPVKNEVKLIPQKEELNNYAKLEPRPIKEDSNKEGEVKIELSIEELEIPQDNIANVQEEEKVQSPIIEALEEDQIASIPIEKEETFNKDFIPINEFARKLILKDRSVSEALADELAEVSNDKINFEQVKNKNGKTEQFALNIGKFSISRNK
jgi:hypothetical protein